MGERVDRDENGEKLKERIRTENGGFDFLEKCGEIRDLGMKMLDFRHNILSLGMKNPQAGWG